MLSAALMLLTASCKSSDTGITPSDQVGITAATFGALRRQNTTGNSYSTYTPSSLTYPIFIDHIKGEIYNPDSLPVRTIPSKILPYLSRTTPLEFLRHWRKRTLLREHITLQTRLTSQSHVRLE